MAEWITLLRTGHEGYGDYRRQSASRYHFSGGCDARIPGQLSLCPPSFRATLAGHKDTAVGVVVWEDNNGLAFFAPVGNKLIRYGHTASVEDLSGTAAAVGVCLHDNGAGTEYVYVSFGAGAHILTRATDGTMAQDDDVHAYQMEPMDDGRLVRAESAYQISICPAGANPITTANWGSAITVGAPHYAINALAHIGDVVIVCKAEGVFAYNPVSATFINLTPSIAPHPDNGKGAASVGGLGVLVPLANGDVIHIDQGLRATSVGPANNALPGRDTPMTRITTIGHGGEWGYAIQEPFAGKTRGAGVTGTSGLGVAVMVDNDTVFTDYSAAATDNNPNTVVDLTALGGAASADYLYVGANYPFEGCYVEMGTLNTTATSGFDTAEYYNGAAWVALTLVDLTFRSIPNCSLARSGYLGWNDRNIPASMGLGTVNSVSKYWVRFLFHTDAAVA
jgi:hypothetical protein